MSTINTFAIKITRNFTYHISSSGEVVDANKNSLEHKTSTKLCGVQGNKIVKTKVNPQI